MNDKETLIVLCTCSDEAEAERIASSLIEERKAACVNILPAIRSIYRWKDKVETAAEVLLLIKTSAESFQAVRERVEALHSYDTPELVSIPITGGSEKYLAWLQEQVH